MQPSKTLLLLCLFVLGLALPAKGQYDFTVDITEGCTPLKVKYTFLSTALVDTITSYYWDFGNGETSDLEDPDTVIYNSPGSFSPSLVFNNRADLWIAKPDFVTVHHTVLANFNYHDTISNLVYVFEPTESLDPSVNYTFSWDIEGFSSRTGARQIITFPSADTFTVVLTISDDLGCTSSISKNIAVFQDIIIQNVFTPNDDGFNDTFIISSNGGFPIKLRIFTRAGTLVYEVEGSTVTWNGYTASGLELLQGVYFYTIEALENDPNKRYSKAGVLYLYK